MLCPVVFMAVPVVYPLYVTIRGTNIPLVDAYFCLLSASLFPLVNALLTVVFVKPYRIHTLHWMRVAWNDNAIRGHDSHWSESSPQPAVTARRRTVPVIVIPT
ncbi:hypothetical protein AAVH_10964 [Aphelenchoides avenae]|nr:hypothetical protein AAVH_10964 [Aphelenchus avenae]